ncbi:hypothetical protein [Hymenobacter sp. GOD-10R]|uniref:hypothetical protein n=1 Tax=Hymenobacter sp. GOD-10R TaxID=3093922 RepID=UPI002D76EC61|nr:hypothetical protein [Hymenobacter sp. GOD-10R]WRQ31656.1 hypothetical protein SD425_27880 [Hymenobacter sp. GOD-10R]
MFSFVTVFFLAIPHCATWVFSSSPCPAPLPRLYDNKKALIEAKGPFLPAFSLELLEDPACPDERIYQVRLT